jgi:hypothetical protein
MHADVALVLHAGRLPVGSRDDVAADVVRVERVGAHADGPRHGLLAENVVLRHHILADQPPGLADDLATAFVGRVRIVVVHPDVVSAERTLVIGVSLAVGDRVELFEHIVVQPGGSAKMRGKSPLPGSPGTRQGSTTTSIKWWPWCSTQPDKPFAVTALAIGNIGK